VRACRICAHPERAFIDKLLYQGVVPRSMAQRFGATTRKGLTHHRDACLKERNL
jgi:hypothetical protein